MQCVCDEIRVKTHLPLYVLAKKKKFPSCNIAENDWVEVGK